MNTGGLFYVRHLTADVAELALVFFDLNVLGYSLLAGGSGVLKAQKMSKAAKYVEGVQGVASGVAGAVTLAFAAKLFPPVILPSSEIPKLALLEGSTVNEDWIADGRYTLNRVETLPLVIPQIHGNGFSISLSFVFFVTGIYYRVSLPSPDLDPDIYDPPVDCPVWARPGKLHVPKAGFWSGTSINVASSVLGADDGTVDIIPAFAWAWAGQILPDWHILLSGQGNYYLQAPLSLLRYQVNCGNDFLCGFTSVNEEFLNILSDEWRSIIIGGVSRSYHQSWLYGSASEYPVVLFPPAPLSPPLVPVTLPWLPLLGLAGELLPLLGGIGRILPDALAGVLSCGGETLTINGQGLKL